MAVLRLRQSDNNLKRYFKLKNDDGTYIDLTDASQVEFHAGYAGDPSSYIMDKTATVEDATGGRVSVTFSTADLAEFGEFDAEFEARWPDGTILTIPTISSQFRIEISGEVA